MQRVRRYTADTSPASILTVIATESGDTDAALGHLAPLLESPYAAPIRWLEAWVLSEAGRLDDARVALAAFDGPLPDDWLQIPLTTAAINAAASVDDVRFLRRHLPTLEPVADRFTFLGEGGSALPSPPRTRLSAIRSPLAGTRHKPSPSHSGWAPCSGCRGCIDCSNRSRRPSRSGSNRFPTAVSDAGFHGQPTRPRLLLCDPPGPA
jgi:hypothetical protein